MRRLLALPLLAALAGCGGSDLTSDQAERALVAGSKALRPTLTENHRISAPWSERRQKLPDPLCEDGQARWRLVATFATKDTSDGDNVVTELTGALIGTGWDTKLDVGDLDDDPIASTPIYRKGAAAVRGDVSILPAPGGWRYVITANTACF